MNLRFWLIINISASYIPAVIGKDIPTDTSVTILQEMTVLGQKSRNDLHQIPEVVGTQIYAGKKSSLILMENVQGNLVSNTMRQVAAKVPGLMIWENDGSGIQINIAARGLSPNRSWEFNVRQNGFDIAADPYGYPEAYYNPQLQSVQRIELVRGHGAIQYGPQLGGMVNYILKDGRNFRSRLQPEVYQTTGSNGLANTYLAAGGSNDKSHYYTFFDHRQGNGWRDNNRFNSNTFHSSFHHQFNRKFRLGAEITRWTSTSQQPGGLTDAQFAENPRQSLRSRNWFDLRWQTLGFTAEYAIDAVSKISIKAFHISGDRNSIGFIPGQGILVPDIRSPQTGDYTTRTIDIDLYRNIGMEIRNITHFRLFRQSTILSSGLRLYTGKTDRFRGGTGSSGSDARFRRLAGTDWIGDINYASNNTALFSEALVAVGSKLLIIPGIRFERLSARAGGYSGRTQGLPVNLTEQSRSRSILLGGLGLEYLLNDANRLYLNTTTSYRPVQFADLTTPPTTDTIDPALRDGQGVNSDAGVRGIIRQWLRYDISLFLLNYQNRVGLIKQQNTDGSFYNLRTNIGSSTASGIEWFTEASLFQKRMIKAEFFTSGTAMSARYKELQVTAVSDNTLITRNLKSNRVEYAPDLIVRSGVRLSIDRLSLTGQHSHTAEVFADANNTNDPTPNGQNGLIPAYSVWDLSMDYQFPKGLVVKAGINNLMNRFYFTRRASGYPGPGVLPADGRTFFLTVGWNPGFVSDK